MKLKKIRLLFFWEKQILRNYQYLTRFLLIKKNNKYFFIYLYDGSNVRPLNVILPRTSTYVKSYDGQAKYIYFLIEDGDLLGKYNTNK